MRRLRGACGVLMLLLLCSGCAEELESHYGSRLGASVNGTNVLQSLLRQEGHFVTTRRRLTPSIQRRADCMIWFPGDYGPPSQANREWLENWLREKEHRVLVVVPRDYDAEPEYWKKIQNSAAAEKVAEYQSRQRTAETAFDTELQAQPQSAAGEWFIQRRRSRPPRQKLPGKKVAGEPRWTDNLDTQKLEIAVNVGVEPRFESDVLLAVDDEILVSIEPVPTEAGDDSYLVIVTNGGFLLNYPLVNHEHRKLALQLIREIEQRMGNERSQVVFLESGLGNALPIGTTDEPEGMRMTWSFFSTPPLSYIFLHLALVGLVFAFSRWPIFGRPREEPSAGLMDFGKHVEALGEILELSGDRRFAQERVQQYYQVVHKETAVPDAVQETPIAGDEIFAPSESLPALEPSSPNSPSTESPPQPGDGTTLRN